MDDHITYTAKFSSILLIFQHIYDGNFGEMKLVKLEGELFCSSRHSLHLASLQACPSAWELETLENDRVLTLRVIKAPQTGCVSPVAVVPEKFQTLQPCV